MELTKIIMPFLPKYAKYVINELKKLSIAHFSSNLGNYAIYTEAWYHYAVGSIVTLVAIIIAFVVALKCFT